MALCVRYTFALQNNKVKFDHISLDEIILSSLTGGR